MRLHLRIKPSRETIPFNHQHLLTGTIHKWMGRNEEHGKLSLYSFSRLTYGKTTTNGLKFESGSNFFISAHEDETIKKLITGIRLDPKLFNGLEVSEIMIQEKPELIDVEHFALASPIFIKRRVNDKIEHLKFDDPKSSEYLVETLKSKMAIAGINDNSLQIQFDTSYQRASTTLVTYKNIKNKANWCPVIIKGKPETKLFAWNVGLGNSTGIGFGALK